MTNPSVVPLFGSIAYDFVGQPEGQNVVFKIQNRQISGYVPLTGQANVVFTQTGKNAIEVTTSGSLMQDSYVCFRQTLEDIRLPFLLIFIQYFSKSKRIPLSSPVVQDSVSNFNITCPNTGSTIDFYKCDLVFDKGSDTILNIDYQDGLTENLNLISKYLS